MTKIPLTISKDYCSDWKVWAGAREMIQNAKDADDDGYAMSIEHYPRTSRLEIVTKGIYVDPAKLLVLGRTDKAAGNHRGVFGEGFVLGTLALVRNGCDVSFRNGELSWTVSFEAPDPPHPLAGNELMTFKSRQLAAREQDFRVEIEGIPTDVWNVLKELFLFVTPPAAADTFVVDGGTLLLHPSYAGKVFARGIFVGVFKNVACGYDLQNLQLDRDRRFVDEFSLHWKLAQMWKDAVNKHPEIAMPRIYDMVKTSAHEARALTYHADNKILTAVRDRFKAEHGDDAVPVGTMAEAKDLEELGGKPAMVNDVLKELLEKGGLTVASAKLELEGKIDARFVPSDLGNEAEQTALIRLTRYVDEFILVTFKGKAACRLIDGDTKVGFDRRLLSVPFSKALKQLVGAEARRRKVEPLDIMIEQAERVWVPEPEEPHIPENYCDECHNNIPDAAPSMVNVHHAPSCSLYPAGDAPS